MRKSVIWSAFLHFLVLLLVVFGLPRLWDTSDPVDAPRIVEMVKISEKTTAKERPKPKRAKPKKSPKKTAAKKPRKTRRKPKNIPEPPDVNRKLAPDAEKVPILPKPKRKVVKKKKKKKKRVVKKPPKQIAKVRPRRRPRPKTREDFVRSLLKDVAPEERSANPTKKKVKRKRRPEKPSLDFWRVCTLGAMAIN